MMVIMDISVMDPVRASLTNDECWFAYILLDPPNELHVYDVYQYGLAGNTYNVCGSTRIGISVSEAVRARLDISDQHISITTDRYLRPESLHRLITIPIIIRITIIAIIINIIITVIHIEIDK